MDFLFYGLYLLKILPIKIDDILTHNFHYSLQILKTMGKVIQECCHANPAARLTALRVKKTLYKLHVPDGTAKIV